MCSWLPDSICTCMHAVAETGLLAQRALFMSHTLLGPNVAIGATDLPADDKGFFPLFNKGKQDQCKEFIISFQCLQHSLKPWLIIHHEHQ